MDAQTVQAIVQRYVDRWNAKHRDVPLWVSLANPGDAIAIPGVTFARAGHAVAGMHQSIRAELIVLHKSIVPESLLTTFLHEYGHLEYRATAGEAWNEVASEVEAIRFSIEALDVEGFPDLAARETAAILEMSGAEPYKSAVDVLQGVPVWQRYAKAIKR